MNKKLHFQLTRQEYMPVFMYRASESNYMNYTSVSDYMRHTSN